MTKNIFGSLLPQILMVAWAVYELFIGINNGQNNRIIISAIVATLFVIFTIITFVKLIKYPNDPTYLNKKK